MLSRLPEHLQGQVRTASVPLPMRAIFSELPGGVALEVVVPRGVLSLPQALCQFVKVAFITRRISTQIVTEEVTSSRGEVALCMHRGHRAWRPHPAQLEQSAENLLLACFDAILEPAVFFELLQGFAFRAAVFETLRTITNHMLRSTDTDEALRLMLSGITSGHALGFNRAALFLQRAPGVLVGSHAMGPMDHDEAHRIWESVEFEDVSIEEMLGFARASAESRFQRLVCGLELRSSEHPSDELRVVLHAAGVRHFPRPSGHNSSLRALCIDDAFILARLEAHGDVLGVLFADNRFNRAPIHASQIEALGFFIDQTALIWKSLRLLKRVERQAHMDPLTDVLNRRAFEAQLAEVRARVEPERRPCTLVLLDVDHFKTINDTLGHAEGDRRLQKVAQLLREHTRARDVIGRFGGDEFQVLLPGLALEDARVWVGSFGELMTSHGVSLSLGVACYPAPCAAFSSLFPTADAHLYEAKRAGRACAVLGDGHSVRFVAGSAEG